MVGKILSEILYIDFLYSNFVKASFVALFILMNLKMQVHNGWTVPYTTSNKKMLHLCLAYGQNSFFFVEAFITQEKVCYKIELP